MHVFCSCTWKANILVCLSKICSEIHVYFSAIKHFRTERRTKTRKFTLCRRFFFFVCHITFCIYSSMYTPQNNLRTKLLFLFAGCPAGLIFKLLLFRYVAQLPLYKREDFCKRFLQVAFAELQKNTSPPPPPSNFHFRLVPSHLSPLTSAYSTL